MYRLFQIPAIRANVNVRATAGLAEAWTPAYSVSMGVISAVEWVPVESGLFSAAAYRASTRQLYLRFQDGKIYRFFDCPVTVYDEFMAAASQGRYFSKQIRNRFRSELVRRGSSCNRGCAQLAVVLGGTTESFCSAGESRCVQQCDMTQAAGPNAPN